MKKRIERKIGYFSGLKEEFIEQKKETEEILENHIFSVEISPKFYLQKKNKSIQDHEKIYLKIEEEMKSLILSVKARSLFMKEDDFDNLQYPSDWGWKMSFLLISFLSEKFKIIFDNYKNNKNTILNQEE